MPGFAALRGELRWHTVCSMKLMKNPIKTFIFGCGLTASLAAFALPEYDLASLETLALESSRSVLAARDQVTAARYAVDSAGAFPNPELEYLTARRVRAGPAAIPAMRAASR
jgi:cobalt-zinc-cadmium efflux system outer membrane protein